MIHLYKILLGLFASVDLSLIFSAEDPGDQAKLPAPIYQNQTSFPHTLTLKRSRWPPIFISFLKKGNNYLSAVEVKKKSIE